MIGTNPAQRFWLGGKLLSLAGGNIIVVAPEIEKNMILSR